MQLLRQASYISPYSEYCEDNRVTNVLGLIDSYKTMWASIERNGGHCLPLVFWGHWAWRGCILSKCVEWWLSKCIVSAVKTAVNIMANKDAQDQVCIMLYGVCYSFSHDAHFLTLLSVVYRLLLLYFVGITDLLNQKGSWSMLFHERSQHHFFFISSRSAERFAWTTFVLGWLEPNVFFMIAKARS